MDFSQLIGSVAPFAGSLSVLRAIFGFIFVLFVPGFAWTLVLFPRVNVIERIALSFGLSIAAVTLSIFALNVVLHISISGFHSFLIILAITVIALVIYALKRFMARQ